jgi:hypothetical protein
MQKIVIKTLFLLGIVGCIIKCWIAYTSSFRIDKILPNNFEEYNKYEVQYFDVDQVFNQKFKFIDKGRQTFVFASEDDKYVIKFIRFHRYSLPMCFQICSSLPWLKNYIKKYQKELDILYSETMASYRLSYEKLQRETATIYIHLNKTNFLNKKIIIFDKLGVCHSIDLDNYGFIVQKKAKSFSKELLKIKNNSRAVEALLVSFFNNLDSMYKKNIINDDRHIINNLGVIDNKVVEIDIGRFALKQGLNKKDVLENEAYNYTIYLKKWLSKNIPEALPILDSQVDKINNSQI